jgi:hypothetical protein
VGFLAMTVAALAEVVRPWPVKVVFDGLLIPQDNPDAVMQKVFALFGTGDRLLALSCIAILAIAAIGGAADTHGERIRAAMPSS